jgi:hypothetical protein
MGVQVPLPPHLLENYLSGKRAKKIRQLAALAGVPATKYLINTHTGEVVLGKCNRAAAKKLRRMGKSLDIEATRRAVQFKREVEA